MRPGWSVSYVDVNPSGHSSDLESLREEPVQQQPSHPLYKTRLCTHIGPCPRGDRCPFAHGPSELRVPRTALSVPSYQFAVALQRPDQHTLEFCNLDGHPQKSEAKADCAAQCIRALGLKVAGNKLVDDDSWVTAGTRSGSPQARGQSHRRSSAVLRCSTTPRRMEARGHRFLHGGSASLLSWWAG